jgi:hypothetical protein
MRETIGFSSSYWSFASIPWSIMCVVFRMCLINTILFTYSLLVIVTYWLLWPFSKLLCPSIWTIIIPDSSTRALWLQHRHLVNSRELAKVSMNLADKVSLPYSAGIFNIPQNLPAFGRLLYFPTKEVVLRIFIELKNSSSSAEFEPANLVPNGKHNHRKWHRLFTFISNSIF